MQKLMSFLGHLFLTFVLLMAAGCWPFRDLAKEVMNSELESVQFWAKRDGKVYEGEEREKELLQQGAFSREEQHVSSL